MAETDWKELAKNPWQLFSNEEKDTIASKEDRSDTVKQSKNLLFGSSEIKRTSAFIHASRKAGSGIGWTRQPQIPAGLVPGFAPIATVLPQSAGPVILARGTAERVAVPSGPNITTEPGYLGFGSGSSAQNNNSYRLHSVANQTGTVWERPSGQVSLLVYLIRSGNAAGNAPIFGNLDHGASPFTAWALVDASGTGTLRFETSAGGTNRALTSSSGLTNGLPTLVIATYDGETMRLFQNNADVGSLSVSGALTYPSAATRGPALGGFYNFSSNRAFVGRVFLAALWDRALTRQEVTVLSRNPWQLFAPAPQPIALPI